MKQMGKQNGQVGHWLCGHFLSYSGTNAEDFDSLFLPNSRYDDDPFGLINPSNPRLHPIQLGNCESIEKQIGLLVNGHEQILIENYSRNIRQGETKNPPEKQNLVKSERSEKPGETKNIPKNFGKQVIKFVKKNKERVQKILVQIKSVVKYEELNCELQNRKKLMRKIGDLKGLWVSEARFSREVRIISVYFLRRHAFNWIFNSRVVDFNCHLKYRKALLKLIQKPEEFMNLKIGI